MASGAHVLPASTVPKAVAPTSDACSPTSWHSVAEGHAMAESEAPSLGIDSTVHVLPPLLVPRADSWSLTTARIWQACVDPQEIERSWVVPAGAASFAQLAPP